MQNLTYTAIPALKDNYIWAITALREGLVMIVDPGDAVPVQDYLLAENLSLAAILITHHHADHTQGIHALTKHLSIPVYGPGQETISGMTHPMQDQAQVHLPPFPDFKVINIPGHTLGHIAYYGDGKLFCGDTLFSAGCGRVFEGTPADMSASLQKISQLPLATLIYCAHEYTLNNLKFAQLVEPQNEKIVKRYQEILAIRNRNQPSLPSKLVDELSFNPFLRLHESAVINSASRYVKKSLSDPIAVFAALRSWKNEFS